VHDNRQQLVRLLGMLGSQHDGEVLNAARLAEQLRGRLNRSWSDLLTGGAADVDAYQRQITDLKTRIIRLETREADAIARANAADDRADTEKLRADAAEIVAHEVEQHLAGVEAALADLRDQLVAVQAPAPQPPPSLVGWLRYWCAPRTGWPWLVMIGIPLLAVLIASLSSSTVQGPAIGWAVITLILGLPLAERCGLISRDTLMRIGRVIALCLFPPLGLAVLAGWIEQRARGALAAWRGQRGA
jgi:hypothetical protein